MVVALPIAAFNLDKAFGWPCGGKKLARVAQNCRVSCESMERVFVLPTINAWNRWPWRNGVFAVLADFFPCCFPQGSIKVQLSCLRANPRGRADLSSVMKISNCAVPNSAIAISAFSYPPSGCRGTWVPQRIVEPCSRHKVRFSTISILSTQSITAPGEVYGSCKLIVSFLWEIMGQQ